MNSRERVIASIQRKPVDQIPFDYWAEPATENRLRKHLNLEPGVSPADFFQSDLFHLPEQPPQETKICSGTDAVYRNFWGEQYIYKQTQWGPVREDIPGALSGAKTLADLKNFNWPSPGQFRYRGFDELCSMRKDKAIFYGMADIWQRPALVRGMENALLDLALRPGWVHYLSNIFTEFYMDEYSRAYRESGGRIDIFLVISDLGGQSGPLISMQMFDEFISPYLKKLVHRIHDLGAYAMFHSCGMIYPFISRLIEIGIDILDPIQPSTPDMAPENLARQFGGKICFHGGIDIQSVLVAGSPAEVETEVRRYISVLGGAGGYICSPSHLFQPDIQPENIEAVYSVNRCLGS